MGALISGGMGDIGRAIALRIATQMPVALLYHSNPVADAERFVHSLPGSRHVAIQCDITNPKSVSSAIAEAQTHMKDISLCVHAAVSTIAREDVASIPPDDFRQQFEVTCFGGLLVLQAVLPRMGPGGRIIAITSQAAEPGGNAPHMAGYVAAKYALRGMLRELSREVASREIGVAAVAPGFVATKLHGDLPEKVVTFLKERQPGRATPEEVAAAVARVGALPCSEMAGRSFPLDGKPSLL